MKKIVTFLISILLSYSCSSGLKSGGNNNGLMAFLLLNSGNSSSSNLNNNSGGNTTTPIQPQEGKVTFFEKNGEVFFNAPKGLIKINLSQIIAPRLLNMSSNLVQNPVNFSMTNEQASLPTSNGHCRLIFTRISNTSVRNIFDSAYDGSTKTCADSTLRGLPLNTALKVSLEILDTGKNSLSPKKEFIKASHTFTRNADGSGLTEASKNIAFGVDVSEKIDSGGLEIKTDDIIIRDVGGNSGEINISVTISNVKSKSFYYVAKRPDYANNTSNMLDASSDTPSTGTGSINPTANKKNELYITKVKYNKSNKAPYTNSLNLLELTFTEKVSKNPVIQKFEISFIFGDTGVVKIKVQEAPVVQITEITRLNISTGNTVKSLQAVVTNPKINTQYNYEWSSSYMGFSNSITGLNTTNTINLSGTDISGNINLKVTANQTYSVSSTNIQYVYTEVGEVEDIYLGDSFSFIQTKEGNSTKSVFAFGKNDKGQLGLGNTSNQSKLIQLTGEPGANKTIDKSSLKVKKVISGKEHTLVWVEGIASPFSNKLFTFGDNTQGQLGLGNTNSQNRPTEIMTALNADLGNNSQVGAGDNHSFVKLDNNNLYVFGDGSQGQLGLGNTNDVTTPTLLTIAGETIKNFTLGGNRSFVETTSGKLFVFGNNDNGQLGINAGFNQQNPIELTIASPTSSRPIPRGNMTVTLGANHSFIETNGKLFVFGNNSQGQLGLGDTSNRTVPTELTVVTPTANNPIQRGNIKKVTLGANHSFIETKDGRLFVFGDNTQGQLGLGDTNDRTRPVELTVTTATSNRPIVRGNIDKVSLGGNSSFIILKKDSSNPNSRKKVFAFGNNANNQLSFINTSTTIRNTPTELKY